MRRRRPHLSLGLALGGGGRAPIPDPDGFRLAFTRSAFAGGYLEVPTAVALEPTTAVSISIDAESYDPAGYSGAGSVLFSQADVAANKGRFLLYRNTTNDTQLVMAYAGAGTDSYAITVYTAIGVFVEGERATWTFVYDGSLAAGLRAKLYKNETLLATTIFGTWPTALVQPGAPTNIGQKKGSASGWGPWQGYIGEVRIDAGTALSAAQVAVLVADLDDATLPAPTARWRWTSAGPNHASEVGGYVGASTAAGAGRAPCRVIDGWAGGGVGAGTKVLVVGDSWDSGYIYDGGTDALQTGAGGWRAECRNQLYAIKKKRVDFVGPYSDANPPTGFLDIEHAAVNGRSLDHASNPDILSTIAGLLTTHEPAICVIGGGFNDILGGATGAQALTRLEAVVRAAYAAQPSCRFVVKTPIQVTHAGSAAANATYLAGVAGLVATLAGEGMLVSLLDAASVTSAAADTAPTDGQHHTKIGQQRVGVLAASVLAGLV